MVQVIENRADVVGTVQSVDANGAVLHVLVDQVADVAGYPNLAGDAVGQTVLINVPDAAGHDAQPGSTIRCRVRKTGVDRYAMMRQ